MISEAVKLEREKRKTMREERFWALLNRPEVMIPLVGVGGALAIQKLGQSRIINRDFAGFMMAAWTAYSAANAGIKDKWALGAITAAATAAYSLATPPTESEALVTIDPGKLLGGDGKLFWWDLSWIPGVTEAT
jgi:hypothetical protein